MACLGVQRGGREKLFFRPMTVEVQRGGAGWRRHCRRSIVFPAEHDRCGWQRLRTPRIWAGANCRSVDKSNVAVGTADLACLEDWTLGFDRMELKSVDDDDNDDDQKKSNAEQLDQWIQHSVSEIVKKIGEAPFLVHVYSESRGGSASASTVIRLVIEKATSNTWPFIRRRWKDGNLTPSGVILVEELPSKVDVLDQKEVMNFDPNSGYTNSKLGQSSTKVWGLLAQGRGLSLPACYILKTCQVQGCLGFCTHFCLSKVKCSGHEWSLSC
ncbi:hypothetical protein Ancab_034070 [Ancistrocladus abbreviatus]